LTFFIFFILLHSLSPAGHSPVVLQAFFKTKIRTLPSSSSSSTPSPAGFSPDLQVFFI
jgi:hypothetical protein